jgi:hypothetical protein
VQKLELWLLVGGVLMTLAAGAYHYRALFARRPLALGAALGIVPGILGAIVILVPRTVLVPVQVEAGLWAGLAIIVSGLFLTAIWLGVPRR